MSKLSRNAAIREAADWIYRLGEPDVSEQSLIEWQRWLERANVNKQAFESVEELMRFVECSENIAWPDEQEVFADYYCGDVSVSEWIRRNKAPPRLSAHKFRGPFALLALSATAAMVILGLTTLVFHGTQPSTRLHIAEYETVKSEHREVILDDDSRVTLGAKSSVTVAYTSDRRLIVLDRGEAFFEVVEDHTRPFVVSAGKHTVEALGTAFNVASHSNRLVVAVAAGSVMVARKETAPVASARDAAATTPLSMARLVAGQQIIYEESGLRTSLSATDPNLVATWRKGYLTYLGDELRYVLEDVNRYSTRPVLIGDELIGDFLFTGTVFQTRLDDWLKSLTEAFPIIVRRTPEADVLELSRDSNEGAQ